MSGAEYINEQESMYFHPKIKSDCELETNRNEIEKIAEIRNDERRKQAKRAAKVGTKPAGRRRGDQLATCGCLGGMRKENV